MGPAEELVFRFGFPSVPVLLAQGAVNAEQEAVASEGFIHFRGGFWVRPSSVDVVQFNGHHFVDMVVLHEFAPKEHLLREHEEVVVGVGVGGVLDGAQEGGVGLLDDKLVG